MFTRRTSLLGSGGMDLTITVRVCDKCKRRDRPATRYNLRVDEAEPIQRDLCGDDAAPLVELFDLTPAEESEPAATEARTPAQRKPAAKKAAAKKATASPRKRRTPVMTMEEIEARKAAAAKE